MWRPLCNIQPCVRRMLILQDLKKVFTIITSLWMRSESRKWRRKSKKHWKRTSCCEVDLHHPNSVQLPAPKLSRKVWRFSPWFLASMLTMTFVSSIYECDGTSTDSCICKSIDSSGITGTVACLTTQKSIIDERLVLARWIYRCCN